MYNVYGSDWSIRVYFDNTVPSSTRNALSLRGADLMYMSKLQAMKKGSIGGRLQQGRGNSMVCRFGVASDSTVGRYCIRDADSRLIAREKADVDKLVKSGRKFHVMHDHPSHTNNPMNGGMWCSMIYTFLLMVRKIR